MGNSKWVIVLVIIGIVGAVSRIGNRNRIPDELKLAGAKEPGETFEVPHTNCKFTLPERPWQQVNEKKLNSVASFGMIKPTSPEVFMVMITEGGGDPEAPTEALAEVSIANLKSVASSSEVVSQTPAAVGGLNGIEIVARAQVKALSASYCMWVCAHQGNYYQLITWSERTHESEMKAEAVKLRQGFGLINPNFKAPGLVPGK